MLDMENATNRCIGINGIGSIYITAARSSGTLPSLWANQADYTYYTCTSFPILVSLQHPSILINT